ncbi:MAG: ribonuclease HII, partial [Microbacterium sp.]
VPASAVGWASAAEIDEVGIMRALGLAASRAILRIAGERASDAGTLVILDGNHDYVSAVHPGRLAVRPVVKADRDCASVSAASVIAKVARDAVMEGLHPEHPAYQWERNKGYASAEHRAAIREHGLSVHHRSSWAIADAPTLF